MYEFQQVKYVDTIPCSVQVVLAADIGGTNANFGIFQKVDGGLRFLLSLHIKSQKIHNFTDVVVDLVSFLNDMYEITIKKSCFGVAGVVSRDRSSVKPTNLSIVIDAVDIMGKTSLDCVYLVNDFEVIGFGLKLIDTKDLIQVKNGNPRSNANKAILGAGTGLGKCIMFYDRFQGVYEPVASEGGHADFAAQTKEDFQLVRFIQETEQWNCNISWEDILSGNGIKRMYRFFRANGRAFKPGVYKDGPPPDEIFKRRLDDEHCFATYQLYGKLYARCAKNFALDSLGLDGVYIAGGIAAHNVELFKEDVFQQEFLNCGKQQHLLTEIPIYVVADYNVSLHGAAAYLLMQGVC